MDASLAMFSISLGVLHRGMPAAACTVCHAGRHAAGPHLIKCMRTPTNPQRGSLLFSNLAGAAFLAAIWRTRASCKLQVQTGFYFFFVLTHVNFVFRANDLRHAQMQRAMHSACVMHKVWHSFFDMSFEGAWCCTCSGSLLSRIRNLPCLPLHRRRSCRCSSHSRNSASISRCFHNSDAASP
jgi:hypothetical protein